MIGTVCVSTGVVFPDRRDSVGAVGWVGRSTRVGGPLGLLDSKVVVPSRPDSSPCPGSGLRKS